MAQTSIMDSQSTQSEFIYSQLRLQVRTAQGKSETLVLHHMTKSQAFKHAAAKGLHVLAIEANETEQRTAENTGSSSFFRRKEFPLLLFNQELLALLEAGLHLNEALSTLAAKERQALARSVLRKILQQLQEGQHFSDALNNQAQHFPEVYIATVHAAERTGDLPKAIARYITYQIQFDTLRKKLISAALYPVMLLIIGSGVMLFLLGYVVPRFAIVYESAGRNLPFLSQLLLQFGQWIHQHWIIAASILFAIVFGLIVGLSQKGGRRWLLEQFLRLPWLAKEADYFRLARFYRALSLLLSSGIALPRAMMMVSGLLSKNQQQSLHQCRLAVEQGQRLSIVLVKENLANPVAESLLKVGEHSGQMAEMLERIARFFDDDFSRWVDWASRLLEPLLMLIIGVLIGTVVVLMYLPIFELAGSLQ